MWNALVSWMGAKGVPTGLSYCAPRGCPDRSRRCGRRRSSARRRKTSRPRRGLQPFRTLTSSMLRDRRTRSRPVRPSGGRRSPGPRGPTAWTEVGRDAKNDCRRHSVWASGVQSGTGPEADRWPPGRPKRVTAENRDQKAANFRGRAGERERFIGSPPFGVHVRIVLHGRRIELAGGRGVTAGRTPS